MLYNLILDMYPKKKKKFPYFNINRIKLNENISLNKIHLLSYL